jgi:hypothetical protein
LQAPLSHTWLLPQAVPFVASTRLEHTCAPVAQEYVPDAQPPPVVHVPPAVHDTHVPLPLQTSFVPHVEPAARGVAVATQVCVPDEQEYVPW